MVMRNSYKIFLFLVVMTTGVTAQEGPVSPKQATVARVMGERDKNKEDQVAKMFEAIRADAKIPQLSRIRHRDNLEQRVCTIALTGTLPKNSSGDTFAIYKTVKPDALSTELSQVASFNNLHPKHNPNYGRYSVAVWRVQDSQRGEATYYVGVQVYWTAAWEFFDYHFTDDIYYHNQWKKSVASECRGK